MHAGAVASIVDIAAVAASWSMVTRRPGIRGSTIAMQVSFPNTTAARRGRRPRPPACGGAPVQHRPRHRRGLGAARGARAGELSPAGALARRFRLGVARAEAFPCQRGIGPRSAGYRRGDVRGNADNERSGGIAAGVLVSCWHSGFSIASQSLRAEACRISWLISSLAIATPLCSDNAHDDLRPLADVGSIVSFNVKGFHSGAIANRAPSAPLQPRTR